MKKMFSIFLIATVILVSIPFAVTSRTDNFFEEYKTILDIYDSNIVYKKDKTSTLIDNMVNIDGKNLSIEDAEDLGYKILTSEQTDEVVVTYPYQTSRLLVGTKSANINTLNAISSIRDEKNDITVLQFESPSDAKKAEEYYDSLPDTFADPDSIMSICEDDSFSANWYGLETYSDHTNPMSSELVHTDDMNDYLKTQKLNKVTVAVVDTGVCSEHPDLKDRIVCADVNFSDSEQSNSEDDQGHGTHVAGIIVDNTLDNIDVLSVKALNSNGEGTLYQVYDGIRYAVEHNANVINLSLGMYGKSELLSKYVKSLWKKNVSFVVAAGNNTFFAEVFTPANIEECITVAAIDNDKGKPKFSNYDWPIDVDAPGVDIYSAWLLDEEDGHRYASGTSMSTPFVSAAAISMFGYDNSITAKYVHERIRNTAQKGPHSTPFGGRDWWYGILDCSNLIDIDRTAIPISSVKAGNYLDPQTIELTCEDNDARIYYTLDGTMASEDNGILYTEPFVVDDTIRVHMVAYCDGKFKSIQSYYDYCIVIPAKESDFSINEDGIITIAGITITKPDNTYSIAIPDTINGIPVLGLADELFKYDTSLKMLILPDTCKTIGNNTFERCTNLIGVRGLGVEKIGDYAFSGCAKLQVFDNYALKEIGKYSFNFCMKFRKIYSTNIVNIPEKAFYNCWVLVDVPLNNVESIGKYAFSYCNKLSYIFSDSVKSVGERAFENSRIESVEFKNIESIDGYTFRDCIRLKSISLGDYSGAIPEFMCNGCDTLINVNIPYATSVGKGAFGSCYELQELILNNAIIVMNCLSNSHNLKNVEFNSAKKIIGFHIDCKELSFPNCEEFSNLISDTLEYLYLPKCKIFYSYIECPNLKYVYMPELQQCGEKSDSKLFKNCLSIEEIRFPKLKKITGYLFFIDSEYSKSKAYKIKRIYAPLINELENLFDSNLGGYTYGISIPMSTIYSNLPSIADNETLNYDVCGLNVHFEWYYSLTGKEGTYELVHNSLDTTYTPTKAGFYYCQAIGNNRHRITIATSNICRYGNICNSIGHTFSITMAKDHFKYECKYCDEIQTHNPDEILSLWNADYLNKPVPQVSSENSHYLDVVQDGVINAKDYAKLKQESKHS